MPALPTLPVTKILLGFFLSVLAIIVGIAAATIAFKIQNPHAQINFGAKPSPSPSPIVSRSPLPSPSPTIPPIPGTWQTYTNEVLGFEFRYPDDATLEEGDLRGTEIDQSFIHTAEFTYGVTVKFTDDTFVAVSSSVNVLDEHKPIDPKVNAQGIKDNSEAKVEIVETQLGGKKAYKIEPQDEQVLLYFITGFGKNENSEITISVFADNSFEQTVNQIISSFKFL